MICASSSASGTVSTRPAGTPTRFNAASHSAADFRERGLELASELRAVALAAFAPGKARVGHQVLASDRLREGLELLLFVRGNVQQPVLGSEGAQARP